MNHSIEPIDNNRTRRVLKCTSVEVDRDVWAKSVFADWPGIKMAPGYVNVIYWSDPMTLCIEPMTTAELVAFTARREGKAEPPPISDEQKAEDARRIELEAMPLPDLRTLYSERGLGNTKGLTSACMAGRIVRSERTQKQCQPEPVAEKLAA